MLSDLPHTPVTSLVKYPPPPRGVAANDFTYHYGPGPIFTCYFNINSIQLFASEIPGESEKTWGVCWTVAIGVGAQNFFWGGCKFSARMNS